MIIPTSSRADTKELAQAACLCTLGDPTTEAWRIFTLAIKHAGKLFVPAGAKWVTGEPAGVDLKSRQIRMGPPAQVFAWLALRGGKLSQDAIDWLETADGGSDTRNAPSSIEPILIADEAGDLGILAFEGVADRLGDRTVPLRFHRQESFVANPVSA